MDLAINQFTYLPLEQSEIRLLTLHPGKGQQALNCSLTHATIDIDSTDEILAQLERHLRRTVLDTDDQEPMYEALSYTWGPNEIFGSIQLNQYNVQIRKNLWQALHRLRHSGKARILWVDALCIDQCNVQERSMQVSIMASIYWRASQVLIWLGESAEGSNNAMRAIATGDHSSIKDDHDAWTNLLEQNSADILSLANRPYWKRLWIIQEVFMGAALSIHCGPDSISFGVFEEACRKVSGWRSTLVAKIFDLRDPYLKPFELLIQIGIEFECADFRDKIYGLLGLVSDPSLRSLKPNYSNDTASLYGEIMDLILSPEYKWPLPYYLDVVGCSWQLQQVLEQPFWDLVSQRYKRMERIGDCIRRESMFHKFDEIALVGPLSRTSDLEIMYYKDFNNAELFEKTISKDILHYPGTEDAITRKRILLDALRKILIKPQVLRNIVDFTSTAYNTINTSFFVTIGGYIGVAPSSAERGDIVCAISRRLLDYKDLAIVRENELGKAESTLVGRGLILIHEGRLGDYGGAHSISLTIEEIQLLTR